MYLLLSCSHHNSQYMTEHYHDIFGIFCLKFKILVLKFKILVLKFKILVLKFKILVLKFKILKLFFKILMSIPHLALLRKKLEHTISLPLVEVLETNILQDDGRRTMDGRNYPVLEACATHCLKNEHQT